MHFPKKAGEWAVFGVMFLVFWIATISIAKRSQAFNNVISTGI